MLLKGHGETVLVVEDEVSILRLAERILNSLGYRVLTAQTPSAAMRLADDCNGAIHLLIADVIIPEMNGRELAERLQSLDPKLNCLFISGYTADIIAHQGILDKGVNFIGKPFSIVSLASKVRMALEKD
jgi:two-component system cell cycle sensor histidine kinase/response regulator CckA